MKNFLVSISFCGMLISAGFSSVQAALMSTFSPVADTTLYSQDGNVSSGGLAYLQVGNTGADGGFATRNALVRFDLSSIPAGSVIDSVTLDLKQLRTGPNATDEFLDIHRVLQSWGEGSVAGSFSGSPAQPGDATFTHRFFGSTPWTTPGGDYSLVRSGRTLTTNQWPTVVTFDSQSLDFNNAGILADVQSWVNDPTSNFGWYLLMPEFLEANARRFGSRNGIAEDSPVLTISFSAVPEPSSVFLLFFASTGLSLVRRQRLDFRR